MPALPTIAQSVVEGRLPQVSFHRAQSQIIGKQMAPVITSADDQVAPERIAGGAIPADAKPLLPTPTAAAIGLQLHAPKALPKLIGHTVPPSIDPKQTSTPQTAATLTQALPIGRSPEVVHV